MTLKLARKDLDKKPSNITLEDIEKALEKEKEKIFYFDQDNSHKDLVKLVEYFEEQDKSVYLKEVKYGLNEDDYMYEVHIL